MLLSMGSHFMGTFLMVPPQVQLSDRGAAAHQCGRHTRAHMQCPSSSNAIGGCREVSMVTVTSELP